MVRLLRFIVGQVEVYIYVNPCFAGEIPRFRFQGLQARMKIIFIVTHSVSQLPIQHLNLLLFPRRPTRTGLPFSTTVRIQHVVFISRQHTQTQHAHQIATWPGHTSL